MLEFPSPNDQSQDVGLFVEASVNVTASGVRPDVGTPENSATGATVAAVTVMKPVLVLVVLPARLVAVSETVKTPGLEYAKDGLCAILEFPSPNDQSQEVGEFVDVSVNCTVNGATPEVGTPVNSATGTTGRTGVAVTLMKPALVLVLLPAVLVAVSETV